MLRGDIPITQLDILKKLRYPVRALVAACIPQIL